VTPVVPVGLAMSAVPSKPLDGFIERGAFHCVKADIVADTAYLHYEIRTDVRSVQFVETVQFPGAPLLSSLSQPRHDAIMRALGVLHLFAGVSYFKASNAPELHAPGLDSALAVLANQVYTHGLAEFCYQNRTEVRARFEADAAQSAQARLDSVPLALEPRALVAIGGGKDSLVSIEALKKARIPSCAVWIGNSELIKATAEATGLATLNLKRTVSPALFALNAEGALNGHVPVTAINSAILLLAALWYGYSSVIFSNEASANAATLVHQGKAVNHQWSKSADFEYAFAALVRGTIAPDVLYFSLLRPYRELAITAKFAAFQHYDQLFSSCNRNFKILGAKPASRWCGACPKCHFVFLALAPFVPKPRLLGIFGRNLLDELDLAPQFDALIEWQGAHKPFECVGEAAESSAAFLALSQRADWQEDALVQRFTRDIAPAMHQQASLAHLCASDAAALAVLPSGFAGLLEALG
jgi:UDP-N-acetyl-alpha-D-muramoyl-L-alanyl-L-glutamate epimerase